MSKATLTAKEKRRKKQQNLKIALTLILLFVIASVAIWWVLARDGNETKNGTLNLDYSTTSNDNYVDKSGEEKNIMSNPDKYKEVSENSF